ncbi:MAG TPA: ATP-binding protein [Myxococcaceae bacterium]|nr:ATP-binding protein [Myxococcaceae bacterium]
MPERYRPGPVPVLLVDDRPENLAVLEHYLEPLDLQIVRATSGEEALRAVLRQEFALILLDVQLQDMSGFEVTNHLKTLERTSHIPIIFLTAYEADISQIYEAYSVGAVDYLVKPVDRQVLRRKAEVFVDLYRQRRALLFHEATLRQAERREHALQMAELRLASDQRYRKMVQGIENGLAWTADRNGQLTFVSERASELLGLSPEALSEPNGWMGRIPEPDRQEMSAAMMRVATENIDLGLSHRFLDGAGRVLWFRTVMSGQQEPNGVILHGLSLDVTELKRAELNQRFLSDAAAALSEPLDFHTALEKLAHLVVPTLADACVVSRVHHGRLHYLVAVHPDAQAIADAKQVKPDEETAAALGPAQALREDRSVLSELSTSTEMEARSPTLRALNAHAFISIPLRPRGELRGVVTLLSTGPERTFGPAELSLAEELVSKSALTIDNARLYEEAREATDARDELLAIVSHDLRNPLSAIALGARRIEMLESTRGDEAADPKVHAAASRIRRAATRMERLLNDLVDLERIKSRRLHLEPHPIAAGELVKETVELLAPLAAERKITLSMESKLTRSVQVRGDAERLMQVFWNLVGNAIKFTPAEGTIVVRVEEQGERVRFSVTDTGPGLSEETIERVFEAHWQGSGEEARQGLGLGLAISRGIVEAHGGRIWAERPEGGGGRFIFELPESAEAGQQVASPEAAQGASQTMRH